MTTRDDQDPQVSGKVRFATRVWLVTLLAVFVVMVTLGITMRLGQGAAIQLEPQTFYALMTMHGLGMAGTLFSTGLVLVWYVIAKRCDVSQRVMWLAYALVLAGAVGLLAATLIGRFGPGWYALYPLPFVNPVWPSWSIGTAIISLMLLGVAWLLVQLDILRAIAARYGLGRMLAWDYLRGPEPKEPLPSSILIGSMCTIAGSLGTLSGAATLMMYAFKWQAPSTHFDPLLLKNTMFMFGHTIVNVAMYCGLCVVYEVLPAYTGRPWKVNRTVAVAWNATLLFVLFAYFHHLYMDFAQPRGIQYLGQVASYASAVPATAVTVFGVGSQLYRSGLCWSFTPFAFTAAVVGWIIGGAAAVLDATIMINRVFHNTLWVPAHFHTYFLVGYVLILLGFLHHELGSKRERLAGVGMATMLAGGYGFVLMFYLGGINSVPRRYAVYSAIPIKSVAQTGTQLAFYGAIAASVFLVGALIFLTSAVLGGRKSNHKANEPVKEQAAAE